jgi:hypothetical protein
VRRIELYHPRRSAFGDDEDAPGGQRCGGAAAEREVGKVDHVAENESADGRVRRGRAVDLQGASAAGERDRGAYRPAIRDFSGAAVDRCRTRLARGGNDLATAEAYDRADRRAASRNYLQAALQDRRANGEAAGAVA